MRLKRVKIFGFKTFADRTEFSLDGGLIAVVGPNGCGKSNLVDAILWGLGEGNARQLRAQTSQDVIFSGSARRKPVGYAEISLLFDNEDGALPIDTSEVQISRRLTRTGDSEYAINRQTCRQRDVFDLLADSGLGRSGYAIVGQKEIDSALSASADERRAWVDEAAGVQRYRARKVESLRRLNQAQEHLTRVDDILRELGAQREPLAEEAEVARRYKSVLGALRDLESALLIEEVASAAKEVADLEARIENSGRLVREEVARADKIDEDVRATGERISALEQEMDAVRGLQQASLTALERAEAETRLAEERLRSLDDLEKTLGEEQGAGQVRVEEARQELEALREEEFKEREGLDRIRMDSVGADAESKQLDARLRELERELAQAREIEQRRIKAEAEQGARAERRKLANRELQGILAGLADLEEGLTEAEAEDTRLREAVLAAQAAIRELEGQLQQARVDDDKDAQAVRRLMAEKAALEGRRRGIEATIDSHEGLNQGARAVMEAQERGLLQGPYVPVGEAVSVDKDTALAIETALGGSMNDLIVDRDADAKTAIAYLKQHRLGRATFQPIPLMRPVEPSYELRRLLGERGMVGRASELVDCEPRFRPVIDSLLGRVLIVEEIDTALRLAKTSGWSRMVTLEGEVVHSSGAVTGGVQSKQGYGLVQRKADLEELIAQIERMDRQIREAEARAQARQKGHGGIHQRIAEQREALQGLRQESDEAHRFAQTLKAELAEAKRSQEKLTREIASLDAEAGPEAVEIDLAALETERDAVLKALAARSTEAEQALERLREAEHRLSQAQLRLYTAEKRLQAAEQAEQHREKRMETLGPERDRLRAAIEKHGQEKAAAQKAKEEADHRLEHAQATKRDLLEKSLQLAEEAKAARQNAASMGEAAHQAEISRARADARRANALQRLYEEYGLDEADALQQQGLHELPPDAAQVVGRMRRELKAMGDVNLGAIEAFERLSQRFDELTAQRADIVGGIEQVQASIAELDKLTRERFQNTFTQLQKTFSEFFTKLFGGGEGHVTLTDPNNLLESGIELEVTLPGKKRQPLQLLSGGERSLCATAFLFGLLKIKPSPLVVLDEVDAPLDGRNVERFADLLQEFSKEIQFIVITHHPITIERADVWLGVTMQEPGVSTLVPARMPNRELAQEKATGPVPVATPVLEA